MKTKPSRPFVYLALVMVFLLILGLMVVGVMLTSTDQQWGLYAPSIKTGTSIARTNQAVSNLLTETQLAIEKNSSFTSVYYIADMSPTAVPQEFLYSPTPTLITTSTLESVSFTQCAYSWAHRDLPDVTALAQAALVNAKITDTTIRADAYGEDCIDSNTNTVMGFGAMTTDFYLTVKLSNLTDPTTFADYVKAAYTALLTLPSDSLPALPGYLDITFTSGADTKRFRAMFNTIKVALDKNLSGAKLLDALGGLQ